MGIQRLDPIQPGRYGVFLGSLAAQPASVECRIVAEMESLGFGTVWYGESIGREAFAHGGILLGASNQIVVASGIANIWARDPQAMAAGARALAEAYPARFILGMGVSHAPVVELRGHSYSKPVSVMREYLHAMAVTPWRGPEAPMPPIVLAALGPRMVELAREETVGDYLYFTTIEHVRRVRAAMGADSFLAADMPVVLADNQREARAIGNRHTMQYLSLANYRSNLVRLGWPAEDLEPPGSDRLFDAIVAWGDIQRIRDRSNELFDAGADHVVLNLITADPGIPYSAELHRLSALTR